MDRKQRPELSGSFVFPWFFMAMKAGKKKQDKKEFRLLIFSLDF